MGASFSITLLPKLSLLTESECREFLQKCSCSEESGDLYDQVETEFLKRFKFVEEEGTLQIYHQSEYLTEPLHDLILAFLYKYHFPKDSTPVRREHVLAFSRENLIQLGQNLKISDSLSDPVWRDPQNPTEVEHLRSRILRILTALNLIRPDTSEAKVWAYTFPSDYQPEKEPDILKKLQNESLSWDQELELTQHTSDYILKEVRIGSNAKPTHGDLIQDSITSQIYILNQTRIERITSETFTQKFILPQFPPEHWLKYNVRVLGIDWSTHQDTVLQNLRGPISNSDYRTFFQEGDRTFHLLFPCTDQKQIQEMISQGSASVEICSNGYLKVLI